MSDGTDEASTERLIYAEQAAQILEKTRRASALVGAPALKAEEIIVLAEYLRTGVCSQPEPDVASAGEFVPVMELKVGDVFIWQEGGGPYVIVRPPLLQGTRASVKVRREQGGSAHTPMFDLDTTVEVVRRAAELIPVTELRVNDVLVYKNDARDRVTEIRNAKGANDAVEILLEGVTTKKAGSMIVRLNSEEEVLVESPRP